jgi:hypothetical protein
VGKIISKQARHIETNVFEHQKNSGILAGRKAIEELILQLNSAESYTQNKTTRAQFLILHTCSRLRDMFWSLRVHCQVDT